MKSVDCATMGVALLGLIAGPVVGANQNATTGPFTFVQLADPQLGWGYGYENDMKSLRQAVRITNALNVDFVVVCGDVVDSFSDQSVGDFKAIMGGLTVPWYPAPGNHDLGDAPTASSLERYRAALGPDYYSLEHKGYTFVIVNTSLWKAPVAPQSQEHDRWLTQMLTAAHDKNSPIFVVGHYPLYITKPDEVEEYYNLPFGRRNELLALYEACGVVAVLGGHKHELIIHDYHGMQLVNGETTSRNTDGRPLGLRLWHVDSLATISYTFYALKPNLDFNSDEIVDGADVDIMVDHWQQDYALCDIAPPPYGDGIVDVNDLVLLSEHLFEDHRMAACWKLDEKDGAVARDYSASRANGVLHGDPVWQPAGGQRGGALALDGLDDYVSTPAILDPSLSDFSVFVWIKGGAPGQVVLSQTGTPWGTNWLRAAPSDGSLMTELKGSARWDRPLTSARIITDGLWHHVGLVWDGARRTLYVDDAAVATDAHSSLASTSGGMNIGASENLAPGMFWCGLMDDVCIYNRVVRP